MVTSLGNGMIKYESPFGPHMNSALDMVEVTVLLVNMFLLCRYVAFDFHKECSRMRWHRLELLLDMVAEMQEEYGSVCFHVGCELWVRKERNKKT